MMKMIQSFNHKVNFTLVRLRFKAGYSPRIIFGLGYSDNFMDPGICCPFCNMEI